MTSRSRISLIMVLVGFFSVLGTPLPGQAFSDMGKLDPFIDLDQFLREQQPEVFVEEALPPLSERPPGLLGLTIDEVIVTGMAVGIDSKIAILRGVDDFTYLAKENAKLFNGYVSSISNDGVVFLQENVDPRGNREITEVIKRLYTEED